MTAIASTESMTVEARALQSLGSSSEAIYKMVDRTMSERDIRGDLIVDVGCGAGNLHSFVRGRFERYVGIDAVRYEGFPSDCDFCRVNLDRETLPIPDCTADVVASVETIEHLENPRAYFRELVRIAKPGGWILVTTPNQLSFLSLLTLVIKRQFSAFQKNSYPAHITALLEIDLRRIAEESRLRNVAFAYSHSGRVVVTPWHFPTVLSRICPRLLSDNLLLVAQKSD